MEFETPKYVYICSSGYSGSTLLDLILGSHSEAVSLGEISHLPKNLSLNTSCTCGNAIRSCPFWGEVLEVFSRRWHQVVSDAYTLNLGYVRASSVVDSSRQTRWYLAKRKLIRSVAYSAYMSGHHLGGIGERILGPSIVERKRLYEAIQEVSGARILVDSSKCYLTGVSLYKSDPSAVRIILLTRDGRGCMYSNVKRGVQVHRAAHAWKTYYSRALPILRKHVSPAHIYQVRYEDLAEDPARTVAGISEFLGLPPEGGMLDYASAEHHVTNGNNMRFVKGAEIRGDYSWRKSMPTQAVTYFEQFGGALNRTLGYERES